MNEREHLLITALEECAEIEQRITKALRFGLDETQPNTLGGDNRARLSYEVNDLLGVLELLEVPFGDRAQMNAKKGRVIDFMVYARKQGTLS